MNKIIYADCVLDKSYKDNGLVGRLKDVYYRRFEGISHVKDLDTTIYKVKLPPNFHEKSYKRNVYNIKRKFRKDNIDIITLNSNRYLDYIFYTEFQKRVFAYSVVKSIQLLLMTRNKSIKKNCIAVYDAADNITKQIIFELSQKSKCLILVSNNIKKIRELFDYIIINYGISPIVTDDINYVYSHSDFIVSSRPIEGIVKCPLWCLDNMYIPKETKDIVINKVTYTTPWDLDGMEVTSELIGGIFNFSAHKNIDEILLNNGILLDEVKFESEGISNKQVMAKKG